MDRSCDGERTVGARGLVKSSWSSLLRALGFFSIFTRSAGLAISAALAPTLLAVAIAIGFPHHRGGAVLVGVDAGRSIPQHFFVETLLTLDLGERGGRCLKVQEGEVGLAVLANPVGEGLDAPIFGLRDLSAHLFDDVSGLCGY